MRLEELINDNYDELSYNEKYVADYIIKHKKTINDLSSEQLSLNCGVSRPTLLRMLKKIGLSSYHELKYLIKNDLYNLNKTIAVQEVTEHYHHMVDDLINNQYQEVCKCIYKAKNIYFYGTGNEQKAIGEELKKMLFSLGKGIMDFFDYGEIEFKKDDFNTDDLFIIISMSGETKEGIQILRFIENTGIKKVSITRLQNNSISRLCDYNLYVGTKMLPINQHFEYELMTSFYVLLDILLVNYLEYKRGVNHEI
ncbi:MurR/RpiR family transcriptional regulator [Thomasclavelia sp.]